MNSNHNGHSRVPDRNFELPADAKMLAAAKVERIARGEKPRVLDLFAGCGGLSLGFQAAGFAITAAIELDPLAAASHGRNFHPHEDDELRAIHSEARDITRLSPEEFCNKLRLGPTAEAFDIVVGGPPCQAFARVGRPKLREIDEHPEAFRHDPRAQLYIKYLDYVKALMPVALLMENVPDILNHGGTNIAEEVCEFLAGIGYNCGYTLLNAAFYGVPQMRERMFLVAYLRGLTDGIAFPAPTHTIELPDGYTGSREVALKHLPEHEEHYYIDPPPVSKRLKKRAVTAKEALDDLPPITAHLNGGLRRGARRFNVIQPYDPSRPVSEYARTMKSWKGFENSVGVADHVIRSLPRDYAIFKRMNAGDQYPQAIEHATAIFDERLRKLAKQGHIVKEGSAEYLALKKSIVPPYDAGKFPNKWRKMEADKPARTLMAHLGKDGYSHIHYDSAQARTISVREAARLQSFPDGFVFEGTMNPAFRQIGNAVPPLLARALAEVMLETLVTAAQEHTPTYATA